MRNTMLKGNIDDPQWIAYRVDIGKHKKGGYDRGSVMHFRSQAELHYRAINIGNGFKKRLVGINIEGECYWLAKESST